MEGCFPETNWLPEVGEKTSVVSPSLDQVCWRKSHSSKSLKSDLSTQEYLKLNKD